MPTRQLVARSLAWLILPALAAALRAETAPSVGTIVTRGVGDTIFVDGAMSTIRGIVLTEPDDIMGRHFSAGFYPLLREDARFSYHGFTRSPGAAGIGYLSGLKDARALRAAKDRVQLCVSLPVTALGLKACDTEHGYRRVEVAAPAADEHRLELTYDGKVGDVIRIGYHERAGAGAAATQKDGTLEVDLAVAKIVSYKRVRLEVLSADASRISYRVVTNQ